MQQTDFKSLFASVRPARVAVLLDRSDPDWQESCLRIIEFFTTLWGGKYNIIVPTDGNTIAESFWELLESFDPDYLYVYQKTLLDLKVARPDKYNEILERETGKSIASSPDADRDRIREEIDRHLELTTIGPGLVVVQDLQNQLKRRIAPFYHGNHIVQAGGIIANSLPHYPLASLVNILPNCNQVVELVSPELELENVPRLWVASEAGQLNASYKKELNDSCGINTEPITISEENLGGLFDLVIRGNADYRHKLPFEVSLANLGRYSSRDYRDWEDPAVVVCGETVEDFCLYYCLSRLREHVTWLLPSWLTRFNEARERAHGGGPRIAANEMHAFHFAHALFGISRDIQAIAKIVLLSNSLDRTQLERFRDVLDDAMMMRPSGLGTATEVRDSIDGLLRSPLILYERG